MYISSGYKRFLPHIRLYQQPKPITLKCAMGFLYCSYYLFLLNIFVSAFPVAISMKLTYSETL
ncbi:MAG: hypothetical protein RSF13_06930, partial [Clostridiales bacterium]